MPRTVQRSRAARLSAAAVLLVGVLALTARAQSPSCSGFNCLDLSVFSNSLCQWYVGRTISPDGQSQAQITSCNGVDLLRSRQDNSYRIFVNYPFLQGQALTVVPRPFNNNTDYQITSTSTGTVTNAAVEIINANPSGGPAVTVALSDSVSTQTSVALSHSTTMADNTQWSVGINLNFGGYAGASGGYSQSMSWSSMDSETTMDSTTTTSGSTETISVAPQQCVTVLSQTVTTQASGSYTLSADITGQLYMDLTDSTGNAWHVALPLTHWIEQALNTDFVAVGAESIINKDGVMSITSPLFATTQSDVTTVVPMDPATCASRIQQALNAAPTVGTRRRHLLGMALGGKPATPAGDALKVVRHVVGKELEALKAVHDTVVTINHA